jgi:L-2,4-diaminobutyrate decarboxylase
MHQGTTSEGSDDLWAARRRIREAYDPDLFRQTGQCLIDLLAERLHRDTSGQDPVLRWKAPQELVHLATQCLDAAEGSGNEPNVVARFQRLISQMLEHSIHLHNPRYVGHQVAASLPIAGLFDAAGAVINQGMAIFEMGPWATAAERALIQRLGRLIGWEKETFAGVVTHGGSMANLTALLTARNVSLEACWENGVPSGGSPPILLVQSDAHYSVARAAGVLGLGTGQVVRVGLDSRRRMDPAQLEEALAAAVARRQIVVAVVACACATPTGAFDPIRPIAQICRLHNVWLHVDAAHGGSAALSQRHRQLLDGIHLADSVAWDAHKMLFVPALCAFVLYRRSADSFQSFRQNAPYLFDPSAPGLAEYDSGVRTFECTKRAAAMGLWGIWALFGPELLADMVDVTFDLGRQLYEKLAVASDFETVHEPQCNIVAFRYLPKQLASAAPDQLSRFQFELRRRIVESGDYYLVATRLDGVGVLRVTLINPLTTAQHLDQLLETIRKHGQKLQSSGEFH